MFSLWLKSLPWASSLGRDLTSSFGKWKKNEIKLHVPYDPEKLSFRFWEGNQQQISPGDLPLEFNNTQPKKGASLYGQFHWIVQNIHTIPWTIKSGYECILFEPEQELGIYGIVLLFCYLNHLNNQILTQKMKILQSF